MTLTSTAVAPTVSGMGGNGGIPSCDNMILSYPMAASSSASAGDYMKFTSSAAGTVEKITATSDTFLGIANVSCDNSTGAAGDKYLSVIRKGFAHTDAVVTASGIYSPAIRMGEVMYLCGSATGTTDKGQRLTATNDASTTGTAKVAKAMDSVATQTTTGLFKIRVYIDTLTNNLA